MPWRTRLWTVVICLAALAAGWVWGASGKSNVELARRTLEDRADLQEARAATLDGRVHLAQSNFGDAGQRFERAQTIVERLQIRWRESGQTERAGQLEIVIASLKDARRLTAALDQTAQDAAGKAEQGIQGLLGPS